MSNIHGLGRKRGRSPERRMKLTIKNGVCMVERDEDGNAVYQEPKTKKRRMAEDNGPKFQAFQGTGQVLGTPRSLSASGPKHELLPIAQLTTMHNAGNDNWRVEWKDSPDRRVTEALFTLDPWILVGHHDSQEAATVVHGVQVTLDENGASSALIPQVACSLPLGKLQQALVCAGPQETTPENVRQLAEAFPKSNRTLLVSDSTFARLQKEC
jgi:hypothetical protein